MIIQKNTVVTMHYTLTNGKGDVVQSSRDTEPMTYLHGTGNIIKGLEAALEGSKAGATLQVSIEPAQGYGERDEQQVQAVPRAMFPEEAEVAVGSQFQASGPQGQPIVVTVVEIGDESVTVDANHPLAGEQLNFDVEVINVRDATEEEVSHGHVHGDGGHHH